MKLGILPSAPGNRATLRCCKSFQISSRIASLVFIPHNVDHGSVIGSRLCEVVA
jgi:hypothetical protein